MEAATVFDPVKPLKNQKALVTGANSGIGQACALALGAAGAAVAVNYVSRPEDAERVAQQIRQRGGEAIALQADVSREEQVTAMFAELLKTFGTIDILVNNAGLQRDSPFHTMTLEQWNTVMGVNLTGECLCAREAVRALQRSGVVSGVSCAGG
jgi:glucose 1-dehydrogenase